MSQSVAYKSEVSDLQTNCIKDFDIHVRLSPAKTTVVYDTYWNFAKLRQDILFRRLGQRPFPWSADPILERYRFTNAYRASDRVSQYLIRNVIYGDGLPDSSEEVLFRILLFKLFNKIETWELLSSSVGPLTWNDYDFAVYNAVLDRAISSGERIYSAAYIMPSGRSFFGFARKHSNHLKLIELMLAKDAHTRLEDAKSMQNAFEILKAFPGLGNFLAYQLAIDINYSTIINFSESDFVVPGPGALGGISKCFSDMGGLNESEIIKLVADRQELEFERLGLSFDTLWGRRLQLIDCQNLFCEVDKYARIRHPEIPGASGRTRIKQNFKADSKDLKVWFPPKWNINDLIPMAFRASI